MVNPKNLNNKRDARKGVSFIVLFCSYSTDFTDITEFTDFRIFLFIGICLYSPGMRCRHTFSLSVMEKCLDLALRKGGAAGSVDPTVENLQPLSVLYFRAGLSS